MLEFAVAGLLGAVLGVEFSVFALVPTLLFLLVFVALGELSRGETIWSTAAAMLLVAISAQLGYFAGSILRFTVGNWRRGNAGPAETRYPRSAETAITKTVKTFHARRPPHTGVSTIPKPSTENDSQGAERRRSALGPSG
jgi:hypothetical protein